MDNSECSIEVWKPVPTAFYQDAYEVSSWGKVRRSIATNSTYVGRILQATSDKKGYLRVDLSFRGKGCQFGVHVLVCSAFWGLKPEGIFDVQVCHRNGIPWDNHVQNLYWGTGLSNARDRKLHGRQAYGEDVFQAVCSQKQVDEIRERYRVLMEQRRLEGWKRLPNGTLGVWAHELGVSYAVVVSILQGRGYKSA